MIIEHQPTSQPAIAVKNLNKRFAKLQAVSNVSLEVKRGEIFGLLGPNGAGKTTTLNMIYGLLKPDDGSIQVLGLDMARQSIQIKARIGVQLQSTSLLPELNAIDQLTLFGRLYGHVISEDEALSLLDQVSLREKATELPAKMSGGQQQRLALALALINDPEIVFLDEPTAGLDPQARRDVWEVIRRLKANGKTVVLTTHYLDEAEALCDRVGIVDGGKLLALDRPDTLISTLGNVATIRSRVPLTADEAAALPAVQSAHIEGVRLHMETEDVPTTLAALFSKVGAQGHKVRDLVVKQPDLEDLFLHLTGRSFQVSQ